MLAKKERLDRKEFDRFFASGRRFHTKNLQLIYSPHPTFHGSVVVGKKVFKLAVRRNRLRRQLYAALYQVKVRDERTGVYIVLAKPSAGTLSKNALRPEVEALVAQVHPPVRQASSSPLQ